MKKILSIILALTLVLGLALTASAADNTETLEIKGSTGTLAGDSLSISWTGTNVKFVTEKASSTTAIRTQDTSHFRAYQGTKTTISALNGEKMAKVEITTTGGDYLTGLQTSLGTPSGATVAANDKVVTITFTTPVDSFVITAAKQWRLENIVVTYAVAGVCNHSYTDCEDTTCDLCSAPRTAPGHSWTNEYDATCNDCTTGTRTVTLPADGSTLDYETANKIAAAQEHNTYTTQKYYVTGKVKTVGHETYGNITIEDANGNTFYLYTVTDAQGNRYGSVADKPVVGDEATFYGPLGRYNSTTQMNPAVIYVEVADCEHEYTNDYDTTCDKCGEPRTAPQALPAADSELTFDVAEKICAAQDHNTFTSDKYKLTGVITEIYNEQYGNMKIKDANGTIITLYGTYSADGSTGYANMTDKPAVGDTITVYGSLGRYNSTMQMKNGWIVEQTPAGPSKTGDTTVAAVVALMVLSAGALIVTKKRFGN